MISFRECLRCNILQPRDCTIISRMDRNRSPSANLVSGQDSTMWIIVCTSPHWHLSVGAMCHLCRLAAQRPCPVRKRFSVDHVGRWRLKLGSLMVGSEIRFLLVTEFDCQSSFHLDATSTGVLSDHIGFLDFSF